IVLHSVGATESTEVTVLGENGKVLEYRPAVDPRPTWEMKSDGLHIHAMLAQRLQDNYKWSNPVVLRITNAKPTLTPPIVKTGTASVDPSSQAELLEGDLEEMGGSSPLEVGFEYRAINEEDTHAGPKAWIATPLQPVNKKGPFSYKLTTL